MQQQNLVKKVAGKLGAKLGLIDSKTRMTHNNSSPSKRNVKSRISQPKTSMRNGVHSNDLRTKKRSPGRPSLKQKLQDRVNHVKTSVHIVSESKKRSVAVRNSKSSVLRSLSKVNLSACLSILLYLKFSLLILFLSVVIIFQYVSFTVTYLMIYKTLYSFSKKISAKNHPGSFLNVKFDLYCMF